MTLAAVLLDTKGKDVLSRVGFAIGLSIICIVCLIEYRNDWVDKALYLTQKVNYTCRNNYICCQYIYVCCWASYRSNDCAVLCILPNAVISQCEENPCENGGTCRKHALSYTCVCPPGFNGSLCQFQFGKKVWLSNCIYIMGVGTRLPCLDAYLYPSCLGVCSLKDMVYYMHAHHLHMIYNTFYFKYVGVPNGTNFVYVYIASPFSRPMHAL